MRRRPPTRSTTSSCPSAFLTTSAGNLYGENGPIASAELTSLTPETVKYTITPNEKWSNGTSFNGNDLVGWWLRARALQPGPE